MKNKRLITGEMNLNFRGGGGQVGGGGDGEDGEGSGKY
jgi:hypothetical protein